MVLCVGAAPGRRVGSRCCLAQCSLLPGARGTAGRRSQPLAKVAVRAKRAGFRGGRCLLTAFLGLRRGLAPPVEPSERGARLSKWGSKTSKTQRRSPWRLGAVRAHEDTVRARLTPRRRPLPWGSTIGSGRNRSAQSWAGPRAALCRRGARARREAASGARPVPRTAPRS